MFETSFTNNLWVEKYRPTEISQISLDNDVRNFLNKCISSGEIPNIMLVGPAGTGKSTCARILVEKILTDESDLMYFNGSKTTGIDNIRENTETFLSSKPIGDSAVKIVYIDEAEYLSQNAQAALRGIVEGCSNTGRFIFTLNNESKIIDPIKSRFQRIVLNRQPMESTILYCKSILDSENIEYSENSLKSIIESEHPDIRKIVNTLQRIYMETGCIKNFTKTESLENDVYECVINIIKSVLKENHGACQENLNKIIQTFNNGVVNHNNLYEKLFFDRNVPMWAKIIFGESYSKLNNVPNLNVHFMAAVLKVIDKGSELI